MTFGEGAETHEFTLSVISSEWYAIRTSAVVGSVAADTVLELLTSDGRRIARNDDGDDFPLSRVVCNLDEGSYRILVTLFGGDSPGQYQIDFNVAAPTDGWCEPNPDF